MPEPRQEVASAGLGSGLWVAGGFDPQRRSSASAFEIDHHGWTREPDLPLPLDHPAAAGNYIAGGFSNGPASRRVFNFRDGAWHELAPMNHARGALALIYLDQRLYAIGGLGSAGEVAQVEMYDTAANAWTDVATLPLPRDHLAGFAYSGKVCVAGGRSPNTPRVDCYDPVAKAWSRLPDLSRATSGAGALALGDEIIVAGGEDAQEGQLVPYVQRFKAGAWSLEPMLVPRHGIELALVGDRAVACGGADQPGYHAVATCTSIGP